ncbi:MAG: 30S ribosomal protein S12 methylthiotransferase RimO [Candidatus Poribacteria bacterium]
MAIKVGIISLGCSKNLVDSEVMLGLLKENGFEITSDEKNADILIINTCAFIEDARNESLATISDSIKIGKKHKSKIIITGCLAQRYSEDLEKLFKSNVNAILGTGDFHNIIQACKSALSGGKFKKISETSSYIYDHHTPRLISTPSHFAYVKIAEGCDNCCSYCVIPQLRGQYRSRAIESVLAEVNGFFKSGVKEAILIAQDTTYYGKDLNDNTDLVSLLKKLISYSKIPWIRVLYAHPEHITDGFVELMAGEERICSYIDIPIQHISDDILRKMGRGLSGKEIRKLLDKIRSKIHDVTLRTSVMVGFPGETDKHFSELIEFLKDTKFDHLGVFVYSPEKGTIAETLADQVPQAVKQDRMAQIAELHSSISDKKRRSLIGSKFKAIVDYVDKSCNQSYARTQGQSPEIDDVVIIDGIANEGEFVTVEIIGTSNIYDLIGKVVE